MEMVRDSACPVTSGSLRGVRTESWQASKNTTWQRHHDARGVCCDFVEDDDEVGRVGGDRIGCAGSAPAVKGLIASSPSFRLIPDMMFNDDQDRSLRYRRSKVKRINRKKVEDKQKCNNNNLTHQK